MLLTAPQVKGVYELCVGFWTYGVATGAMVSCRIGVSAGLKAEVLGGVTPSITVSKTGQPNEVYSSPDHLFTVYYDAGLIVP